MTDAPRISDAEKAAFLKMWEAGADPKDILAAFLRARVPDARDKNEEMFGGIERAIGFNACRDQVLKGRE